MELLRPNSCKCDPRLISGRIWRGPATTRARGPSGPVANSYRVELFQDVIPIAGRDQVALAASAAFSVTRGSGHFQVYARVFAGGWPGRGWSSASTEACWPAAGCR